MPGANSQADGYGGTPNASRSPPSVEVIREIETVREIAPMVSKLLFARRFARARRRATAATEQQPVVAGTFNREDDGARKVDSSFGECLAALARLHFVHAATVAQRCTTFNRQQREVVSRFVYARATPLDGRSAVCYKRAVANKKKRAGASMVHVGVRIRPEDLAAIERAAERADRKPSEYIRMAAVRAARANETFK